jgi:preprotein translocase subunit SecA
MLSIVKKLFGSKTDRDFREIKPLLDQTLQAYESIKHLDNDQLRAKTQEFRARIRENVRTEQDQIDQLRHRIEEEYAMDVEEKELLYNQIDALEKVQDEKTEEVLKLIIPEAFSVIKETARRFKENAEVSVTATDMDRDLAASRPSITIKGNAAIYQNQWMAGGNDDYLGHGALRCAAYRRCGHLHSGKDCRDGHR